MQALAAEWPGFARPICSALFLRMRDSAVMGGGRVRSPSGPSELLALVFSEKNKNLRPFSDLSTRWVLYFAMERGDSSAVPTTFFYAPNETTLCKHRLRDRRRSAPKAAGK